MFFKFYIILFV
jgi:regulator-associated protein of mTOR